MSSIVTLARVPVARITRTPRALFPVVGWTLLALVVALSARASGQANAVDHVMRGTFGPIVLPLLTYAIVGATFAGNGLRPAIRGLVALGASRASAALASVVVAMVASAVACAVVAALACGLAHGPTDPPLASDLPASFGVAFVGGAAYAAYFAVGSAIGRGALRAVFLGIDFVIGAPAGFGALFVPRGHVMSLLGGSPCFDLSRRTSSVLLVVLLFFYFALSIRLGRRSR
jgi:hypothetical protein